MFFSSQLFMADSPIIATKRQLTSNVSERTRQVGTNRNNQLTSPCSDRPLESLVDGVRETFLFRSHRGYAMGDRCLRASCILLPEFLLHLEDCQLGYQCEDCQLHFPILKASRSHLVVLAFANPQATQV